MNFHTVLYSFLLILPEWTHQYQLSRQTLIPSLNFVLVFVLDQAKQQRLEEARSLDEANFSTFELRQSRRGTMKSNRTTTIDRNTVDRDPSGHRDRDRDSRGKIFRKFGPYKIVHYTRLQSNFHVFRYNAIYQKSKFNKFRDDKWCSTASEANTLYG